MRHKLLPLIALGLQNYKPIDSRLRKFKIYKLFSEKAHAIYWDFMKNMHSISQYYTDIYHETNVDPKLVVFESSWGHKVSCNPYAVFKEMLNREEYRAFEFVWSVIDGAVVPAEIKESRRVRIVKKESREYAKVLLEAGILFSNGTLPDYFIRKPDQIYINLWHGTPIKHMGLKADPNLKSASNVQRNFLQASSIPLASPYAVEKTLSPSGAERLILPRAEVLGSPRIDLTLSADSVTVKKELGFSGEDTVILYAPTWRGKIGGISDSVNEIERVVAALERGLPSGYKIIVSIHNFLKSKLKSLPVGVKLVPDNLDMNYMLAGIDCLISDYSSIFVDYFVLDRPVILYTPDRGKYEEERGLYLSLEALPVNLTGCTSDLPKLVIEGRKPSEFDSYEEMVSKLIPIEDGYASSRVLDLVSSLRSESKEVRGVTAPDRKTRLLFYTGGLHANGITTSLINLLSGLDYDRFEVVVLVDSATAQNDKVKRQMFDFIDQRCQIILRTPGMKVTREEAKVLYRFEHFDGPLKESDENLLRRSFEREFRRIFSETKFDIAVEFGGYSHFWGLIIASSQAKRTVIYQHSDLYAEFKSPNKSHSQLKNLFKTYKYFDTFVAVSESLQYVNEKTLANFYPDNASITYARNAIDFNKIRSKAIAPLAVISQTAALLAQDNTLKKFICVGRLSPEKNHSRLLRAFKHVLSDEPNSVLFVVGEGSLKSQLISEAIHLGIDDHVVFTGRLPNPYPLLAISDCLVLPSDYEGQGMVLLEALTLGVPCVGTDITGIRCVLKNGIGSLTDLTASSLAEGMLKTIRQEPNSPQGFSIEEYSEEALNEFYENVCGLSAFNLGSSLRGNVQVPTKINDLCC
ncbi:CDP-glycerol glycerophosphotransferase family protein [Microbulbifer sp. JMSA008]|uniref:CDP-glycerol glycerophosphotransferase family protein n=1 Tax=Microbulbifer sp. JMSA008 TaxID=3243373 RepID=UPI00403A6D30